ncbi:MAG TPA: YtxH domain-containing protein [Chitinophagaceae bacterium]|jgi:gas vesicle protein|nr:YtxH domain-containing protein [Chitinophagaceae bacterium]
MKNSSKVLIALGAGIAIGGLLGVLFAPDKGKDTRKKIADSGKKFSDEIEKKFRRGKEKFSDLKDDVKERFDALNQKVEEYI